MVSQDTLRDTYTKYMKDRGAKDRGVFLERGKCK